jgi:hypothetical protein
MFCITGFLSVATYINAADRTVMELRRRSTDEIFIVAHKEDHDDED